MMLCARAIKFGSDLEFVDWYNGGLHGALKLEWAETPNEAFIRKLRPETHLGRFLENVAIAKRCDYELYFRPTK